MGTGKLARMSALFFVLELVCFVVKCFGGAIGSLDLIALGLAFMAAGHLLGGGTVDWVRKRIAD